MGLLEDLAGGGGGASMPNLNQLIRPPDPLGAALAEMSQRFAQAGQASRLPTSTLGALGSALGGAGAAADAANKTYLDQAIKLQALQRALKQAGYDDTVAKFIAQRMLGGGAQATPVAPAVAPTATTTPGAPTAAPYPQPGSPRGYAPGAPPAGAPATATGGGYDPLTGNPLDAPAALSPLPPAAPRGMVPVNLPPGSPGTVTWGNTTYGPAGGGKIITSGLLGPNTVLPTEGGPAAGDTQANFRPASLVEPARAGNGGADPLRLAGLLASDPEAAAANPYAGLLATDAPIQPGGPDTLVGQARSQLPVELASMAVPRSKEDIVHAESGGNPNVGYGGVDLSNAPRDPETGFPQWAGRQGPAGISHAAGKYQFQPATWAEGARALGINDFSEKSQDAVYNWTRAKYGDAPWRASEGGGSPIIKAQYAPGAGGAPALVGPGSGTIPGLNMTPQEVAALNALSSLAGHPNPPFKEFLDLYYKDPEYLRQAAEAAQTGRNLSDLQYQPRIQGLGELYKNPALIQRAQAQAEIDRVTDELKQRTAAGYKTDETLTVQTANGPVQMPVTAAQKADILSGRIKAEDLAKSLYGNASMAPRTNVAASGAPVSDASGAPGQPAVGSIVGTPYFSPAQIDRNKAAQADFDENVAKPFQAGQKALLPLTQIENAMRNYQTGGATPETELAVKKGLQYFANRVGIPTSDDFAKEIASGEIIRKSGNALGFELARSLGSREAENVVNQAIQSNPGLSVSPTGNTQLIGLIKQGIQRDFDKHQFYNDWFNGHGTYVGADDAFNTSHPVDSYVNRVLPPSAKSREMKFNRQTGQMEPM